ncbi:MAG: ATP-binding protein [Parcubacteria group bacterium]|nr:ATP-binding protein [Parcubacteria group bacterium]
MLFINREEELGVLHEAWGRNAANLYVVYGKRRVGKTELIRQFIKDKPAVYYLADKRSQRDQLAELGRLFGAQFSDFLVEKQGFTDWLDVLRYLKEKAVSPFIFAVDEFTYLVEGDKSIPSVFQKGWDEYLKDSKVTLILSGSSISMMESEVLGYSSPLYGRRSGQILVQPLNFQNSWKFFPGLSFKEFLEIFSVTGGMPAYLLQIDPAQNLRANLTEKIFAKAAFLHSEVEFLLREELREPRYYLSILRAISFGKTKFGEIVNETGIEKSNLTKYLGTLEQLKLIERLVPVTEKNREKSRKGLYFITDNFVRFWFQFVFAYKSNLEIGQLDEVNRKLDEQFHLLTSNVYEEVCRELVRKAEAQLFPFERVGKWWEAAEEIDIVAINDQTKEILFGEVKWSEKPVGTNIYEALKAKAAKVEWNAGERKERFVLFSKSGFTAAMRELAKQEDVVLFHEDCLLEL